MKFWQSEKPHYSLSENFRFDFVSFIYQHTNFGLFALSNDSLVKNLAFIMGDSFTNLSQLYFIHLSAKYAVIKKVGASLPNRSGFLILQVGMGCLADFSPNPVLGELRPMRE